MRSSASLKKYSTNIGLLFITFILLMLLCEGVFRIIYPPATPNSMRSFEYHHSWKINSDGFRDDAFADKLKNGKKNIIFLGDSFTAGMGVEKIDSFSGLFSNYLSNNGFEVFNLGKIGTGTSDHSKILKKFQKTISPRYVFLFFYWNDVQESLVAQEMANVEKLSKVLSASQVDSHPFLPIPKNIKSVLQRSIFYRWVAYKWRIFLSRIGISKLDFNRELDYFDVLDRNPETTKAWEIVKREIDEIKTQCVESDSRLCIIYVPKREQLVGWSKIIRFYHLASDEFSPLKPNRQLKEICDSLKVSLIDITESMSGYPSMEKNYYQFDTHFTMAGNRLFYELVLPHLKKFIGLP